MKFQDLDLTNKLPYVKSNNLKVIVLGAVVFLLILITVLSNLYGSIQRKKNENLSSNPSVVNTISVRKDYTSEAPVLSLMSFIKLISENKTTESERYFFDSKTSASLEYFVSDIKTYKNLLGIEIVNVEYSKDDNTSYVIVGVQKDVIDYHSFTMQKVGTQWKIVSDSLVNFKM